MPGIPVICLDLKLLNVSFQKEVYRSYIPMYTPKIHQKNPQSVNFNREIFTRSPDALLEEERSLQDLIVSLMTVDPKKRPTATEVWAGEIAA